MSCMFLWKSVNAFVALKWPNLKKGTKATEASFKKSRTRSSFPTLISPSTHPVMIMSSSGPNAKHLMGWSWALKKCSWRCCLMSQMATVPFLPAVMSWLWRGAQEIADAPFSWKVNPWTWGQKRNFDWDPGYKTNRQGVPLPLPVFGAATYPREPHFFHLHYDQQCKINLSYFHGKRSRLFVSNDIGNSTTKSNEINTKIWLRFPTEISFFFLSKTHEKWLRSICRLPECNISVGIAGSKFVALMTEANPIDLCKHTRRSNILIKW